MKIDSHKARNKMGSLILKVKKESPNKKYQYAVGIFLIDFLTFEEIKYKNRAALFYIFVSSFRNNKEIIRKEIQQTLFLRKKELI